jgi:secondary thiamine-phosphate synthase enzyme
VKQHQEALAFSPTRRGLHEITDMVSEVVSRSGVHTGLCLVFLRHTSASLVIQENADPSARTDLEAWFERIAPDGDPHHRHTAEGPDDMPSHVRAALTRTSETLPVVEGRLGLGTWQGLYLFEHRLRPGRRSAIIHVWGE